MARYLSPFIASAILAGLLNVQVVCIPAFSPLAPSVLGSGAAWAGDALTEAIMLYGDKKYGDSEKLLMRHIETNPRSAEAHYYLASCLHYQGKTAEAIKEYQTIINSFPGTQAATYSAQALASIATARTAARPAQESSSRGGNPFEVNSASKDDVIPDQEWIPFSKGVHGHLTVKAFINGKPLEMMFDSGASGTVISLQQWQSFGFPRPSGAPTGKSHGIGGSVDLWNVPVEVQLGKIKKHINLCVVEKLASEPLLGETFFGDFQYNIDNRAGYIHFFAKGHNSSASAIPYNSIDIPFRNFGTNMVITGKVNGRSQDFFFDTGAATVHFSYDHLRQLGIRIPVGSPYTYMRGVGGSSKAYMFNVDTLEVGDLRKTNFAVYASGDSIEFPLLGQSFFGDRKYVVDNDRKLIRFIR
jgi:clan AA aspartic protease (TIGR02281 family)